MLRETMAYIDAGGNEPAQRPDLVARAAALRDALPEPTTSTLRELDPTDEFEIEIGSDAEDDLVDPRIDAEPQPGGSAVGETIAGTDAGAEADAGAELVSAEDPESAHDDLPSISMVDGDATFLEDSDRVAGFAKMDSAPDAATPAMDDAQSERDDAASPSSDGVLDDRVDTNPVAPFEPDTTELR